MFKQLRAALVVLTLMAALTGVLYPLFVTAAAQLLFPSQANGSLIQVEGQIVGSALIGQGATDPRYFWSRPSAVNTMMGDSISASGASNLGWTSEVLRQRVRERETAFRTANGLDVETPVPAEMLFASGSGLDPHISPEAARLQIGRVAEARGLQVEQVAVLVEQFTEGRQFGIFGEPRINVLLLNLALDETYG